MDIPSPTPLFTTSPLLQTIPGLAHGFFGAKYQGERCMNGKFIEGYPPLYVEENRRFMLQSLGLQAHLLAMPIQVHSTIMHFLGPRGLPDMVGVGLFTDLSKVAVGVLTADCIPVFVVDPYARIIGAIHIGWRGALEGAVAASCRAFCNAGGAIHRMHVAVGPCIPPHAYTIDTVLYQRFYGRYGTFGVPFFIPYSERTDTCSKDFASNADLPDHKASAQEKNRDRATLMTDRENVHTIQKEELCLEAKHKKSPLQGGHDARKWCFDIGGFVQFLYQEEGCSAIERVQGIGFPRFSHRRGLETKTSQHKRNLALIGWYGEALP